MRPMTARWRGRGRWAKADEEEAMMVELGEWGGRLLGKKPQCVNEDGDRQGVVMKQAYSFLLCCACVVCGWCG